MIIFGIVLVLVVMGAVSYYLYKVLQDQKQVIEQVREEDTMGIENNPKKVSIIDMISDGNFEDLLADASKDLDKLDELRRNVQSELRKAVKEKNINKSRTCNEYLKRIDEAERRIQN